MVNSLEVTTSGYIDNTYYMPYNSIYNYHYCEPYFIAYTVPRMQTLNLINVESFKECQYPIVKYVITEKPRPWYKAFQYFINPDKFFNVERKILGTKTVTWVTMRSGEKIMIDESSVCLQNALDACVWTADMVES